MSRSSTDQHHFFDRVLAGRRDLPPTHQLQNTVLHSLHESQTSERIQLPPLLNTYLYTTSTSAPEVPAVSPQNDDLQMSEDPLIDVFIPNSGLSSPSAAGVFTLHHKQKTDCCLNSNQTPTNTPTAQLPPYPLDRSPPDQRISISSSSSWRSSTSILTQQPFIDLLEEICTEAARQRWALEVERRLVENLERVRRNGPTRRHRTNGTTHRHPSRWTPYTCASDSASSDHRHEPDHGENRLSPLAHMAAPWSSCAGVTGGGSSQLMGYTSLIANAGWERARGDADASYVAEGKAVEEMGMLYALVGKVVGAVEGAIEGRLFGDGERERVAVEARGLCLFLGCEEGARKCEELVGRWGIFGEVE